MHAKNLLERKPKSLTPIISIAILLALLIHIILLYIIFVIQSGNPENLAIEKVIQEDYAAQKKSKEEPLSLPEQRSHASLLGNSQNQAQVILYEEPSGQSEQLEQITTLKETPAQQEKAPVFEQVAPLIQVKELEQSAVVQKDATLTETNVLKQVDALGQINSSGESLTVAKKQKFTNPFMPKYGSHEQPENSQLQNIGKGFLEAMERGGNDSMNMSGDKRMATDEEIKEISYMHRVIRALQSSFKSDAMWITLAYDEHVETKAKITIDSNGNISSLTIFDPPQNNALDRHIRELIYHACPFAPIPKYLGRDTFNFQVRIYISMSAGTHRMQWHCE